MQILTYSLCDPLWSLDDCAKKKMIDEKNKRNEEKVNFYFSEKVKAHIILESRKFLNGYFDSEFKSNTYYWFVDDVDGRIRLFLTDIFDIKDYTEKQQ